MSAPRNLDAIVLNPAVAERRRRILRPWRIAFILYWLAQTAGTHWPNLKFGPEVPASDKTIHVMAMVSCTMLLWFTQWIRSRWLVALTVVCWAGFDEITQGIPGLNRSVSWLDYSADVLGVIIALTWMWALAPIGVGPNRARHAFITYSLQEQFASRKTWLAIGAGIFTGLVVLLGMWKFFSPERKYIPEIVAVNITIVLTLFLLYYIWQQTSLAIRLRKPCLVCGQVPKEALSRTMPLNPCPSCEKSHSIDWAHILNPPPRKVAMRQFTLAGVLLAAAILFVFAVIFIITFIYSWLLPSGTAAHRTAPHLIRLAASLPSEFTNALDFSFFLIVMAAVVRLYRSRLSRWYDRAARCAGCGFDLRATPVDSAGKGVCPECGAPFSLH